MKKSNLLVKLDIEIDEGSVDGYITYPKTDIKLTNYLNSHSTPDFIKTIKIKYKLVAVLTNMHIEDNKRGQRIGTRLLKEFIANAYIKKAEAIILIVDTNEANEFELIEWYEKYNFIVVHKNENSYPVMLKIL